jgi:hypothetical protein
MLAKVYDLLVWATFLEFCNKRIVLNLKKRFKKFLGFFFSHMLKAFAMDKATLMMKSAWDKLHEEETNVFFSKK